MTLSCAAICRQLSRQRSAGQRAPHLATCVLPPLQKAMATDPQLIFSFQRGNALIPYDPPRPVEAEDDEYGAYYG